MYELRQAGAKGYGLFATSLIRRGTRILADRPLFTVRSENEVYARIHRLTSQDQSTFWNLAPSTLSDRPSLLQWPAVLKSALFSRTSSPPITEPEDLASPTDTPTATTTPPPKSTLEHITTFPLMLNIFRNNNFDIGSPSSPLQAVFERVSRFNHSCVPNCQGNFHEGLGAFAVHAVRDVLEGEELSVSYLVENGVDGRESRRGVLRRGYGFECGCGACGGGGKDGGGEEGERRRGLVRELLGEVVGDGEEGEMGMEDELRVIEAMLDVFEWQGIAGREVGTMYLRAAELAAKLGRGTEPVREYAERGVELERDCLGEDSAVYRESLAKAKALITDRAA